MLAPLEDRSRAARSCRRDAGHAHNAQYAAERRRSHSVPLGRVCNATHGPLAPFFGEREVVDRAPLNDFKRLRIDYISELVVEGAIYSRPIADATERSD